MSKSQSKKVPQAVLLEILKGNTVASPQDIQSMARELKAARTLVSRLQKMTEGCTDPKFAGYENGNGIDVGTNIDKALATYNAI
jgi:hypothetical protein